MTVAGISGAATAAPFFGALQHKSAAQATTGTGSSSGSTGGDSYSVDNIGSTFLNLLVQELQNQDPTQPMDPTAMVGQMISLNQLDQLVSINQDLTPATTAATTPTTPAAPGVQSPTHAAQAQGSSPAASGVAALDPMQTAAGLAGQQAAMAAALGAASPTAAANSSTPLDLGKLTALFGGK